MTSLYCNGYLVKAKSNDRYLGIEGDCWCLYPGFRDNMDADLASFEELVKAQIEKNWMDTSYVDVSNDIDFVRRYVQKCAELGIDVDVLYCRTTNPFPSMNHKPDTDAGNLIKIGYDYAYGGGSYYSCILNDIGRVDVFNSFQINEHGLLNTLGEIIKFVDLRRSMIEQKDSRLEMGDFIIYELWQYNGDVCSI